MLSVPYSSDVPRNLIDVLEHHARNHGVSLDALEVIGKSLDDVEAFIVAAEDGQVADFLARLFAPTPPLSRVEVARIQAARLFGA